MCPFTHHRHHPGEPESILSGCDDKRAVAVTQAEHNGQYESRVTVPSILIGFRGFQADDDIFGE